jgi:hypothetical protein
VLSPAAKIKHLSHTDMQIFGRILGTLALLAVSVFCLFGFLASYEYSEASQRLPWQTGYGLGGLICVFVAWKIWLPLGRSKENKAGGS